MDKLEEFAKTVAEQTIICNKEVLTSKEAAAYMGVSMSYLYKLTMNKEIPHYKPMGKVCYFNRLELEKWLQSKYETSNIPIAKKIDFDSIKTVKQLQKLGIRCLCDFLGGKDEFIKQINKAREEGVITPKQAFDLRNDINSSFHSDKRL